MTDAQAREYADPVAASAHSTESSAHGGQTMQNVDESALTELATELAGHVLWPGDEGFVVARAAAVWDGAITRQQAVIAQAATAQEVVSVVAFARQPGVDLTVRGGGHSWCRLRSSPPMAAP